MAQQDVQMTQSLDKTTNKQANGFKKGTSLVLSTSWLSQSKSTKGSFFPSVTNLLARQDEEMLTISFLPPVGQTRADNLILQGLGRQLA